MHTFTASDGTVFIYNPDLSDVRIKVPSKDIDDVGDEMHHVTVSGPALYEFIGNHFRKAAINELENADLGKLFTILTEFPL